MREAEDIRVIYDRRSGQTHFLAPDLAAVLDSLAEGPADAAAVAERLSRAHALEVESGDVVDIIAARLDELGQMGLADPEP